MVAKAFSHLVQPKKVSKFYVQDLVKAHAISVSLLPSEPRLGF
jgi:hypothetical protein